MKTVKEMIQRYRYKYRSRNVVEVSITPDCTELILVIFILILIPFLVHRWRKRKYEFVTYSNDIKDLDTYIFNADLYVGSKNRYRSL